MANYLNKIVDRTLDLGMTYLDIRLEKYETGSVAVDGDKHKEVIFSTGNVTVKFKDGT